MIGSMVLYKPRRKLGTRALVVRVLLAFLGLVVAPALCLAGTTGVSTGVAIPITTYDGEFDLWITPGLIGGYVADAETGVDLQATIGQFVAGSPEVSDSVSLDAGFWAPGVSFDTNDIDPGDSTDVAVAALAVGDGGVSIAEFALGPVTPNPCRGLAQLDYAVAHASRLRLTVHDVQGREVAVLVDGQQEPGRYRVRWNLGAHGLAAGMYFVRFDTPDGAYTRRVVLTQ